MQVSFTVGIVVSRQFFFLFLLYKRRQWKY